MSDDAPNFKVGDVVIGRGCCSPWLATIIKTTATRAYIDKFRWFSIVTGWEPGKAWYSCRFEIATQEQIAEIEKRNKEGR